MQVFVTGSSGLIGTALVQRLESAGHRVIHLVRGVPKNDNERRWETDGHQLSPTVLEGCDVLVHLAGENIASGRWSERKKEAIYHSRVDSTAMFAETIAKMPHPPQAFVVASAIGYYGDRGAEAMTETSSPGDNFLASVCRDWEQAADAAREVTRVVHVRTGMVLSPEGGALKPMLLPFKMGVGGVVGSGNQYWSWITLEDISRLFAEAVTSAAYRGAVNGVAPHPVTSREFTKTLGAVLHRPTVLPMPGFAAKLALGEMARELILASTKVLPKVAESNSFKFAHPELKPALESLKL